MDQKQSVLIVQPNPAQALEIQGILLDAGFQLSRCVSNLNDAVSALEQAPIDWIISEVDLEEKRQGLVLAEKARELDISILLLSNAADATLFSAIKAVKPQAFLVRPFDRYSLLGALSLHAIHPVETEEDQLPNVIFLRNQTLLLRVRLDELLYVFAESNYCILVERKRRITVKYSLPQILPLLPAREFIQVHRNYIVRIDEIESVSLSHNELHIFGQVIPVSRQKFREDLMRRLKVQK